MCCVVLSGTVCSTVVSTSVFEFELLEHCFFHLVSPFHIYFKFISGSLYV